MLSSLNIPSSSFLFFPPKPERLTSLATRVHVVLRNFFFFSLFLRGSETYLYRVELEVHCGGVPLPSIREREREGLGGHHWPLAKEE